MNTIRLYATIRLRQAFRVLQDAGWTYVFILLPLALMVYFYFLEVSLAGNWPMTALVFILMVGGFHFNRKDHDFLDRFGVSPFFFRLIDYVLLFLPMLIGLLILLCIKDIFIVLLALPILAAIRPPERLELFANKFPVNFIPVQAFEWRCGLRRYGWWLSLLYVLALFACRLTGAGIGFTILLALIAAGFFDDLEEKNLLETFQPVKGFLSRKMAWQALCFHGLLLPHYLLSLLFHSQYWYLLLTAAILGQTLLWFSLFYKYAHWNPHQKKAYNQVALGIFSGFLIVPFLAPAALVYCVVYYRKAQKNLNYYYGE